MRLREHPLQLFTTFAVLRNDIFDCWQCDAQLRRSMQLRLESLPYMTEQAWAIYWHQQWQANPTNPLPITHLAAYLQETCYWVAQQMSHRLTLSSYGLADYFQIANSEVERVLRAYRPDRGRNLRAYASIILSNALKDQLRQRQAAAVCSNWALLRKVSKKRLRQILERAGLPESEFEQYEFAWFCFKQIYTANGPDGVTEASLTSKFWIAITDLYNHKYPVQLTSSNQPLTPKDMELRLGNLGRWTREYLYPTIDSLNRAKVGAQTGELQDDVIYAESISPLDMALVQEEVRQRQEQQFVLRSVLVEAIAELSSEIQILLRLFYQQELSQQVLAAQLNLSQSTVSRRLKQAEAELLEALLEWMQAQVNEFPHPDVLNDISMLLRAWLRDYYQSLAGPTTLPASISSN